MSAEVSPFPWAALDATSRAEVATLRALRAWAREHVRAEDVASTLSALIETRVEIIVRRAGPRRNDTTLEGGIATVLAPADATDLKRSVVVEAEGTLTAAIIARAMRRNRPSIIDASNTTTPGFAGAFAAVVAAIARRAHARSVLRVLATGPSSTIVRDVARASPRMIAIDLTVILDDEAHLARVLLPSDAALVAPIRRWSRDDLAALGDVALALPIVASVSTATALEVAQLARGDAWLPGAWPLTRAESGEWVGAVSLAAPSHDVGVVADLGENGQLVLRGEVTALGWAPNIDDGDDMVESNHEEALIEAVGEVPVVVRVEVGTAQMRAREWAALSKGDVVALGRRIADPVVLRVGGVEIARGELVELEGEVAVRIVERIDGKGSRT